MEVTSTSETERKRKLPDDMESSPSSEKKAKYEGDDSDVICI